jgi:basic membrane lipoprotein Med (substrate-binding protein (PBP1-ABC) superfamily)
LGCALPVSPVAPSWIATSAVSHTELAVFAILNATLWNEFPGGQQFQYNLANGGVNITTLLYSSTYISLSIRNTISTYKDDIIAGSIIVTP